MATLDAAGQDATGFVTETVGRRAAKSHSRMKRLTIRIDFGESCQLGPGKVRILEMVDTHGSITASAKMMDMSYRRAWLLIDELNRMFEAPLVETRLGGRGGANARLSVLGRAVVQLYRAIEKDASEVSSARVDELHRRLRPAGKMASAPAKAPRKKVVAK
jgi:molybdate transport system regulatory protein